MKNLSPWYSSDGVYIIAEIGGNHEGNFEYAKELTELACQSQADCIKFQIYTGDSLVNGLESPDRNQHFKKFQFTPEQYLELKKICEQKGKTFGASVWDIEAIDWISPHLTFFKVGSGDLTAYPVLKELAKTKKPIMLSTGLSDLLEIKETVAFLENCNSIYKKKEYLSILQCTSMYPIPYSDANLNVITTLTSQFPHLDIGYSDHTEGKRAVEIAVALGAKILEVHFTDTREGKTFRDHKVSLVKDELIELRKYIKEVNELKGLYHKGLTKSEIDNNHPTTFRRALYFKKDLAKGTIIKENDLVALRPNHGIDARDFSQLIGKRTTVDLMALKKLKWNEFE